MISNIIGTSEICEKVVKTIKNPPSSILPGLPREAERRVKESTILGKKIVSPDEAFAKIRKGMNSHIGTGVFELQLGNSSVNVSPRNGLRDLTVVQLAGLGESIFPD